MRSATFWTRSSHSALESLSSPRWLAGIVLGTLILKLFAILHAWDTGGLLTGDSADYVQGSMALLEGRYPATSRFPPGMSALLTIPSLVFGNPRALLLLGLLVHGAWCLWLWQRFSKRSAALAGLAILFISCDPIWWTQSVALGADYFGTVIFSVILFHAFFEAQSARSAIALGLSAGLLCLIKPVHVILGVLIPVLFAARARRMRGAQRGALFIGAFLIPVLPWALYRHGAGLGFSLSEHGLPLLVKQLAGYVRVAKGQADSVFTGITQASENIEALRKSVPDFSWSGHLFNILVAEPVLTLKLMVVSASKVLFGNANVQFTILLEGTFKEGPGLWKALTGASISAKETSYLALWLLGAAAVILEKIILLGFSARAAWRLFVARDNAILLFVFVLIGWIVVTPLVFGEPRYFLPGTIACLYLMIAAAERTLIEGSAPAAKPSSPTVASAS